MSGSTGIADELRALLELVTEAGPPVAAQLEQLFVARGLAVRPAGPMLERPAWSAIVAPEDSFVDIGGAVAGVRFGDDPRGYGAYAELYTTNATLADVEAVTGALTSLEPRIAQDKALFARVSRHDHRVAVYVAHEGGQVRSVRLQF